MISVHDLRKRFPGADALRGLTFEVAEGEIFGFVGPNGAGKTTTLRALATLLRPDAGGITVAGVDIARHPREARRVVGYMPDFFGVYDHLTAAEYLRFYAGCYGIRGARADRIAADLLELVQLAGKRDAQVNGLSRGMKQRLCLARALVHDPLVLLLDEPASGLDPRARVEMRDILRELRRMGKTIVVSSHILPELGEMCTVFGIIDAGRMVASGSLGDLLRAETRCRARVVVLGPRDQALARLAELGWEVSPAEADDAVEIAYPGTDEAAAELLAAIVGAGVRAVSFTPLRGDLESAFLQLTAGPPDGGQAVAGVPVP